MINLNVSTTIYRPVRQVFDYVSMPENDFQWQYGTLATANLSDAMGAIGALFRSIGHLMGRRVLSTFEVTEYEPHTKYAFKSVSGPLNSVTCYTFEMIDGCTKVNVTTHANIVNSFHINEALLEKRMKKQLQENLTLLKTLLEGKGAPSALETKLLTARM